MKTNQEIYELVREKKFDEADKATRERMISAGMTEKQVSCFCYLAYENSHAYGHGDVISAQLEMLECFEGTYL